MTQHEHAAPGTEPSRFGPAAAAARPDGWMRPAGWVRPAGWRRLPGWGQTPGWMRPAGWRRLPALQLLRTEMKVQLRAGFYAAYAIMTLLFFVILALLPPPWREHGFELIVLMDPTFMGFFFAGGLVLLEADQGVLSVALTRGRGFRHYWRTKVAALLVLALTVVAALTGAAWAAGFIRPDAAGLLRLASGLVVTVPLFFGIGVIVAGWFPRLIEYFVFSSLVLLPVMFPLLEPVGIPIGLPALLSPLGGGMILITSLFDPAYGRIELMAAAASSIAWNAIVYRYAAHAFRKLASGRVRPARRRTTGRDRASATTPARPCRRLLPAGWADVRLLLRDPMGPIVLLAPLLASAVIGRGIPWLLAPGGPAAGLVPEAAAAAALSFMDHFRSFVLLLGFTMYGMLGALLILDEKDQGVLPFLRTLPGPPGWFLLRRCAVLLALCAAAIALATVIGDLMHAAPGVYVLSLAVDALILPLFFLGMSILASNKIQGLAMAKVLNVATLPPLLMIALPDRWVWLAGVVPTAWGSLLRLSASGPAQIATTAAAGFIYAGLLVAALYRRAQKLE